MEENGDTGQLSDTPTKSESEMVSAGDATSVYDTSLRSSDISKMWPSANASVIMGDYAVHGTAWSLNTDNLSAAAKSFLESVETLVCSVRDSAVQPESTIRSQQIRENMKGPHKVISKLESISLFARASRTTQMIGVKQGSRRDTVSNDGASSNRDNLTNDDNNLASIMTQIHEMISLGFDDVYLACSLTSEFCYNYLPITDKSARKRIGKLLAKIPGEKNPKPDVVYGISPKALSQSQIQVARRVEGSQISEGILYPFLVFEWQSEDQSKDRHKVLHAGRRQAMRSGAALVNTLVELISLAEPEKAGEADTLDDRSFVFSFVVTSTTAVLHLHFRHADLERDDEWYLSLLSSYMMHKTEDVTRLRRRDVHNILAWGRSERLPGIQKLLDTVGNKESLEMSQPVLKRQRIQ